MHKSDHFFIEILKLKGGILSDHKKLRTALRNFLLIFYALQLDRCPGTRIPRDHDQTDLDLLIFGFC